MLQIKESKAERKAKKKKHKLKERKRAGESCNLVEVVPSAAKFTEKEDVPVAVATERHNKKKSKNRKREESEGAQETKKRKRSHKDTNDSLQDDCMTKKRKKTRSNDKVDAMSGAIPGLEESDYSCSSASKLAPNSRKRSNFDMEGAVKELEEFIPNVRQLSENTVYKMARSDLKRFREFKKKGISLRHGRYSTEENKRIMNNVKNFLSETGIDCATKLFFPKRFPEQMADIVEVKKKHSFYLEIAEGIPRPWHDVYSRCRKMFDDYNYKGKFTQDELDTLCKWQKVHGSNWMKISELTQRSNQALEKRFNQIAAVKGPWTEAEEKKLMNAMREYILTQVEPEHSAGGCQTTVRKERLYSKVPWQGVASKVGTRNWTQCKRKWMTILKQKMTAGENIYKGKESLKSKIRLIKRLYEMDVADDVDVNWEELGKTLGNVPPAYVQAKFYRLKLCRVPMWQSMAFCDIVDFLYLDVLPQLKQELTKCKEIEKGDPALKEIFTLSEIFGLD